MQIGIIGAGKIVEDSHLPVLANMPSLETSWVFDLNSERANAIAKVYDADSLDKEELKVRLPALDFCLVAVPYGVRKEYYDLLKSSNARIYLEKPYAFSLTELEDLNQSFGEKMAVGFQRRYYQSVNNLKSIIREQFFGRLLCVTYVQGYYDLRSGGKGKFHTDVALAGGGVIAESAIHGLDVLVHLLEPTHIQLKSINCLAEGGMDYDSQFLSEFLVSGHNVEVKCEISRLRPLGNYFELNFEHATLSMNFKPDAYILVKKNNSVFHISEDVAKEKFAVTIDDAFYLCWEDFISTGEKYGKTAKTTALQLLTGWLEDIYNGINAQ